MLQEGLPDEGYFHGVDNSRGGYTITVIFKV
jgi:hypothetical protein